MSDVVFPGVRWGSEGSWLKGVDVPVRAQLLEGAARQAGIDAFVDLARAYAVYLERTDRTIRVFSLGPLTSP